MLFVDGGGDLRVFGLGFFKLLVGDSSVCFVILFFVYINGEGLINLVFILFLIVYRMKNLFLNYCFWCELGF